MVGAIDGGLMLLVGIAPEDTHETVVSMAAKVAGLKFSPTPMAE